MPLGDEVTFFSPPCLFAAAVLVDVDMRCARSADARHLVMVIETLVEIARLADIDRLMTTWRCLARKNVISRNRLKAGPNGVNVVPVVCA